MMEKKKITALGDSLTRGVVLNEEKKRLMHAPIIDITTPFDKYQGAMRRLYCSDGIHPNAEGHRLIAASIAGNSQILV
jgi:lysophospholipase L1-like esterase